MRAARRKRPRRRVIFVPTGSDLNGLADQAMYVGSPAHKDRRGFAGLPRPRADASICPREILDQATVNEWLRSAIRRGATGAPWENGFPRYVRYKEDEIVFEGRLVNRGNGSYKGYPLEEDEWPDGIEDLYAEA